MPAKQHPNLFIIMSDEHAPMYSGPYGPPFVQTPHMDKPAMQGFQPRRSIVHIM